MRVHIKSSGYHHYACAMPTMPVLCLLCLFIPTAFYVARSNDLIYFQHWISTRESCAHACFLYFLLLYYLQCLLIHFSR